MCLPFGTFERVIAHPSNSQTTWTLEKLLKELEEYSTDSGVPPTLAAIRDLVTTFLKVLHDWYTSTTTIIVHIHLYTTPECCRDHYPIIMIVIMIVIVIAGSG